ncbi:uncharacterized protein [Anas platyrhynchos]|uniref:uncharacterized protein n=1 Tax=Anas platyrhynchos TaxID=8839 RepID=UPI003AF26221
MSSFEIYSPYICFSVRLPLPYHEFQCLVSRYTVHVWGLSLPPQCLPNTSLIRAEADPQLPTASFQAVAESNEASPEPPLPQTKPPQPLLTGLVLQALHQLRSPALDALQGLHVLLVLRGPKLPLPFPSLPSPPRHFSPPPPSSREIGAGQRQDGVTQEEIKKEPEKPIDREKTCPLLLRVFTTNNGRHHRMDEFSRGNVPSSELQIYTWMDATLKELTSLVKEVYPEARKKGTHFNFAIVFTDLKRPGYRVKEIGSTMSGRKGTDDSMTLQSQKFQIGDYLDIAITPPNRAPPPSSRMRPY